MREKKLQSKEIQEQMGNKVIDIYQSEKGYKAISEALGLQWTPVRAIIHKWMKKTWNSGEPSQEWPNKSTPRGHQQLIQEATKDAWTPYKTLQASLEWFNNMKEREFKGKNHCWPKRTAHLTFITKHLDDAHHLPFWKNTLWTDKTKVELFARCASHYMWHKNNTASQKKNIILTVKHDGGVLVRDCFAASGPGRPAAIDGTMNSARYQKILAENVRPSLCEL